MTTTTITNQAQCLVLLAKLGVLAVFRPVPPQVVSDSILPLDDTTWIIGTNDRGRYTLHFLEDATKAEAWEAFENIRGPGTTYVSPRVEFCGREAKPACN